MVRGVPKGQVDRLPELIGHCEAMYIDCVRKKKNTDYALDALKASTRPVYLQPSNGLVHGLPYEYFSQPNISRQCVCIACFYVFATDAYESNIIAIKRRAQLYTDQLSPLYNPFSSFNGTI